MNGWIKTDSAPTVGDANLMRAALEQADLEVELRGELRSAAAGGIPMGEADVEVWVRAEDAEKAREVLTTLRNQPAVPPKWCVECGEENPGNFDECWKCKGALSDVRPAADTVEVVAGPARGQMGWLRSLLMMTAIGTAGFGLGRVTEKAPGPEQGSGNFVVRRDSEHCLVEQWRRSGLPHARWCSEDRGSFRTSVQYGKGGWKSSEWIDEGYDGVPERAILYGPDGKLSELADDDQDGVFERSREFAISGTISSEHLDNNGDGRMDVIKAFDPSGKVRSETYDDDHDDWPDRQIDHHPDYDVYWTDRDHNGLFDRRELRVGQVVIRVQEDHGKDGFVDVPIPKPQ